MSSVTVPGPPESPVSRRAARALREETPARAETRASRRADSEAAEARRVVAEAERAAAEQAEIERAAAERAAAEQARRAAAERAEAERAAAERAAVAQARRDARERAAEEHARQAAAERADRERRVAERAAIVRAQAERKRVAAERAAARFVPPASWPPLELTPGPQSPARTGTLPIAVISTPSTDLLAPAESSVRARPPSSAPASPRHSRDDGSARRVARLFGSPAPVARHARHGRRGRGARVGATLGLLLASVLVVGSTAAMTHALTDGPGDVLAAPSEAVRFVQPPPVASLTPTATPEAAIDVCADPGFTNALANGDDVGAIAAAGGADRFRAAVAEGRAPCVDLSDSNRVWVVIDKVRPLVPQDFSPPNLQYVAGLGTPPTLTLGAEAANALTVMAAASAAAGVGQIGLGSGFRSYDTQRETHESQLAADGEAAEASSARPGFSEHQSGLAADVIPCDAGACGTLDDLAVSAQGAWIAANAAEYGWIVRYTEPGMPVTGYESEPWHLRYVGVDLARAYVAGGWTSLEEFFGLPPAPDYL